MYFWSTTEKCLNWSLGLLHMFSFSDVLRHWNKYSVLANSFALCALMFKIHVYACCLSYFVFHKCWIIVFIGIVKVFRILQRLDESTIQSGSFFKLFSPLHHLWLHVPDYKRPVSEQKEYSVIWDWSQLKLLLV